MLAEIRGVTAKCARGERKLGRHAQLLIRAPAGVHQVDDHLPLAHLLVAHHLVQVEHRFTAAVRVGKQLGPLGQASAAEQVRDVALQFLLVRAGLEIGGRVPVRAADGPAEQAPELRFQGAQGHVAAVAGLVEVVAGKAVVEEIVGQTRHDAIPQILAPAQAMPAQGAIGHGDVDVLAPAQPLPGKQGGGNAEGSKQGAAAQVGDLHPGQGRAALAAAVGEHAVERQVVDVVPGPLRPRPVRAVAGDGAVDEPGIDRLQRREPQAQPVHDPGSEPLQDHVRLCRQPLENLLALRLFQVQGQRPLVAVEDHMVAAVVAQQRRPPADVVPALGIFHLDHISAEIRQQHGAERPRQQTRQVEHFHTGKGSLHGVFPPGRG